MKNHYDASLEIMTSKTLIHLGFPTYLKGYEYMRRAVIEAYHSPELTTYITKTLFPRVSRLCGHVSVSSVSRGCRHAIEYASDFGLLRDFLHTPNTDAYPSSALVISSIAKHLHSSN